MGDRVSFSGQNLGLIEISDYYNDVESSLRAYYNPASMSFMTRFALYTEEEVRNELEFRLSEHSQATILTILASLEAAFRIDYLQRVYKKKKDSLSKAFRGLHNKKGSRASLVDDIFPVWIIHHSTMPKKFWSDLNGAFKQRHWLAHGRYWTPKFGRKYDYDGVYLLAQQAFSSLGIGENQC